ncbi:MAG: pyridoxamine kinase [Faecalimonas sp.]|nr:pyridoxamine kinase [Faecalimonas sp.]
MVKRVAVINDLSGLGKCSLTAAIPVLSVMGVQACPIPTAILTNQTGYDSYYCDDYTDKFKHYTNEWKKRDLTLDGIYTGFLGSAAQVEEILHFCKEFRREDTLLFVDPVMGDNGKVYDVYTPELGKQMHRLVTHADVITPNLTECCLLTGTDYAELTAYASHADYLQRIKAMAASLFVYDIKTIVVTGIIHQAESDTEPQYYNLVVTKDGCNIVSSPIHGCSYSGTGDLMASVVCAGIVRDDSATDSVQKAVRFLEAALIDTIKEAIPRNNGLNFEPYLSLLLND